MRVEDLMTKSLKTCAIDHTLDCAARIMWETDCGVVPVVDHDHRIVGMITDRDICIAAYTQNKRLGEIPVGSIGLKRVVIVRPNDPAEIAETLMQRHQVRRLAVVGDHERLVGVLSLNDLARGYGRHPREIPSDGIARTLAAVSQPHNGAAHARA